MSNFDRNDLESAIFLRFQGKIEKTLRVPTSYPNIPFKQPATGVYAEVKVVVNDSNLVAIAPGANRYREVGRLDVMLRVPLNQGTRSINLVAKAVKDAFRSEQVGTSIFFRSPFDTPLTAAGEPEYRVNVTCPFDADSLGG